jgi:hypothetical protein
MLYFQINKGMYGLPQAGLLAQNRLIAHIAEHGYTQSDTVPCLFRHATNGITFVLVVDDFGIKFRNAAGCDHLLTTLRMLYKITVDIEDPTYLGMTIKHDKAAQTITCSMPEYIDHHLHGFAFGPAHEPPSPQEYTPHPSMALKSNTPSTTTLTPNRQRTPRLYKR